MPRQPSRAFTLIELLIAISVLSILSMLLTPVLGRARSTARGVQCGHRLGQLGAAWQMYGGDNHGYAMPQCWPRVAGDPNPQIFWWGDNGDPPDHTHGPLYPYLGQDSGRDTMFDCPDMPFGTYLPQGAGHPTTTYGYNGLYFCAPYSGYRVGTANVAWRRMGDVAAASRVFLFADTMMDMDTRGTIRANCYLDGPSVPSFSGRGWQDNPFPTLHFRHRRYANVCHADGHVDSYGASEATLTSPKACIGYVGEDNAPHYVPDWQRWYSSD